MGKSSLLGLNLKGMGDVYKFISSSMILNTVDKGYCQILWYDAKRNLPGKSEKSSLLGRSLNGISG